MHLSTTPEPPYYAVVFTSLLAQDHDGYAETSDRMTELVRSSPGYLAHDSARDDTGTGITVAYFRDEESIETWRRQAEHVVAQDRGRAQWYDAYEVRVAKVERAYGFRRVERSHPRG
ncbi:antibiotic biosynthesis monooxygenase family protein [Actinokineospora enzanensis]|uniref:antibiotic biosynthesis monooxygenase family protein n=1 Tax=Actinokineospora enzanensis TaxID=155975 RepID=UPI00036FC1D9|nr:antibiotic biosynthesis monooxygenase [Actinokineospora enzanensis]